MYVAPLKRLKTLPVLTAGARLEPFEGTADDGATGLDASTLVDLGPTRLRVGDHVEALFAFKEPLRGGWAESVVVRVEEGGRLVRVRRVSEAAGERQVPSQHVRLPLRRVPAPECAPGDLVEVPWDGLWLEAEVTAEHGTTPPREADGGEGDEEGGEEGGVAAAAFPERLAPDCEASSVLVETNDAAVAIAAPPAKTYVTPAETETVVVRLLPHGKEETVERLRVYSRAASGEEAESGGMAIDDSFLDACPSGASGFRRPEAPARDRIHKRKLGPDNGASVQGDVALADVRALNPVQRTCSGGETTPSSDQSTPQAVGRTLSGVEVAATLVRVHDYDVARVTVPSGAQGGQTLILSVQRPPELIDLTLPAGCSEGDRLCTQTSHGCAEMAANRPLPRYREPSRISPVLQPLAAGTT